MNEQDRNQLKRIDSRLSHVIDLALIIAIIWACIRLCGCSVDAQAKPEDMERAETVYRLTQCVIGECDSCKTNHRERDAIGYCLKKQAAMLDKTLLKQTIDYCAFYKQSTPRARAIFGSDYLDPLHGNARLWLESKQWAAAFVRNPPPDPLPLADQWGGDMDILRAKRLGLKRVAGPPVYANTFYRSKAFASFRKRNNL